MTALIKKKFFFVGLYIIKLFITSIVLLECIKFSSSYTCI